MMTGFTPARALAAFAVLSTLALPSPASADPAPGSAITYTIPTKATVSLNIVDKNGWICRELLRAENQDAGAHTVSWDGRDADGHPLPPGSYDWKLLYHTGLHADYLLSVANSGQPPYRTDDGKGSWGGCHGNPLSVQADATGLYLTWLVEEGNAVFAHTDYDGRSLYKIHNSQGWGRNYDSVVVANVLYRLECGATGSFIQKYDATTGKSLNWETAGDRISSNKLRVENDPRPIPEKTAKKDPAAPPPDFADARWIAANAQFIAVSFPNLNKLAVFRANGEPLAEFPVDQPRGLVFLRDGRLAVAAGKTVTALELPSGKSTGLVTAHLDAPTGLALSLDGQSLWVTDQGTTQQARQFSLAGALLKSVGKPGGMDTEGQIDHDGLRSPRGIACGTDGNLYITEDSPLRRITRWSPDGKRLREWFGPLGPQRTCWPNLNNFTEVYYQSTEGFIQCRVDLDRKTWEPVAWYQIPLPNGRQPYVFENQGHKFLYDDQSALYRYNAKTDRWLPAVVLNTLNDVTTLSTDLNGDGTFTGDEIQTISTKDLTGKTQLTSLKLSFGRIDPKTLVLTAVANGDLVRLEPSRITETGLPVYSVDRLKRLTQEPGSGPNRWSPQILYSVHGAQPTADGGILTAYNGGRQGRTRFWDRATWNYLVKFSPDGRLLWRVGEHVTGKKNRNPAQQEMIMRLPGLSHGVVFLTDIESQFHAYTDDGLYVGWLMDSDYQKHPLTPNSLCVENVSGLIVDNPKDGGTYLFSGSTEDARIWKLSGFDSFRRLSGSLALKDSARLANTTLASASYVIAASPPQRKREPNDYGADGYLNEPEWTAATVLPLVEDGQLKAEFRLRYDDQYLWIGADVLDDSPAASAAQDPETAFVRGDAIDLYLSADAAVSAKHDTGGVGDVRIVLYPATTAPMYNGAIVLHRMKVAAGAPKKPFVFESPAGSVTADSVTTVTGKDAVTNGGLCTFTRWRNGYGYTAEAKIPISALPELVKDRLLGFDAGVIFSNTAGDDRAERLYWHQNNADTQCTVDLPTEAQIHPTLWSTARLAAP